MPYDNASPHATPNQALQAPATNARCRRRRCPRSRHHRVRRDNGRNGSRVSGRSGEGATVDAVSGIKKKLLPAPRSIVAVGGLDPLARGWSETHPDEQRCLRSIATSRTFRLAPIERGWFET